MVLKTLNEFQSIEFFPLIDPASAGSGTPTAIIRGIGSNSNSTRIQGNSILSTVYVKAIDPGTQLDINYTQSSTGSAFGESELLDSHDPITSPGIYKILVTKIHNKPICNYTISGGNVEFGVYATVINSTASDIDAALHRENEAVDFVVDKGIPIVGVDGHGDWVFARFDDVGNLKVSGLLDVKFDSGTFVNFHTSSTTDPGIDKTIYSQIVPALKIRNLASFSVSCRQPGTATLLIDGVIHWTKRLGPTSISPTTNFSPRIPVAAGSSITVKYKALDSTFTSDIDVNLHALEEDA